MGASDRLRRAASTAALASSWINRGVERVCVALLVVLVLDVWLGVLVRYVVPWPLTFMEEAARYLMIWTALLAISCGIARREHIGVQLIFDALPPAVRRGLAVAFDAIAFGFCALLVVQGIGFVERGFGRLTMIYETSKALPFAAVPVAAAVACVQLALVGFRDWVAAAPPRAPDSVAAVARPPSGRVEI